MLTSLEEIILRELLIVTSVHLGGWGMSQNPNTTEGGMEEFMTRPKTKVKYLK